MNNNYKKCFFSEKMKTKFKYFGIGVKIGDFVKIVNPEVIEIGDFSRIDDFSVIVGGKGLKIGSFVHIASFCSITGGGKLSMGDYSTTSAGVRMFTSTDDFYGKSMVNPVVPKEFIKPIIGNVVIKKHVIIGANSVLLPNVIVHEGVAVGACSLINKNLKEWTINAGIPCKFLKERKRDIILNMEQKLEKKYRGNE